MTDLETRDSKRQGQDQGQATRSPSEATRNVDNNDKQKQCEIIEGLKEDVEQKISNKDILTLALGYFKGKGETKPMRTRNEDEWELNKQMREEKRQNVELNKKMKSKRG